MRKCIIPHKKSRAWVAPVSWSMAQLCQKKSKNQPITQKLEDNLNSWFRQPNGEWYYILRWGTQRVKTSKGEA